MSEGVANPLGPEAYRRIARILAAETSDFNELVRLAGLDPTRDFRHADLAGTSMTGADLRGFDFRYSDFRSVDLTDASIAGARFEHADLTGTDLTKARGVGEAAFALAVIQDAPFAPELVVIPTGSFLMGSTEAERQWAVAQGALSDWVRCEQPQHQVRIAYPLAVGRYPVTFEEYDHFAKVSDRKAPDDEGWGRGRRPVVNVSWHDAKAYVEWLAAETGQPYRLLSEAEWEYACRAGTTTHHWWGHEIAPDNANYGKIVGETSEVGSYRPNTWCLHDMNSNVWEWVEDCWNKTYDHAPDDGRARTRGDCQHRVFRGGSWKSVSGIVRAAYRNRDESEHRENNVGFRAARALMASRSQNHPLLVLIVATSRDESLERKIRQILTESDLRIVVSIDRIDKEHWTIKQRYDAILLLDGGKWQGKVWVAAAMLGKRVPLAIVDTSPVPVPNRDSRVFRAESPTFKRDLQDWLRTL
jgi:formylglycine-generating enzyme required for sulfatase activity